MILSRSKTAIVIEGKNNIVAENIIVIKLYNVCSFHYLFNDLLLRLLILFKTTIDFFLIYWFFFSYLICHLISAFLWLRCSLLWWAIMDRTIKMAGHACTVFVTPHYEIQSEYRSEKTIKIRRILTFKRPNRYKSKRKKTENTENFNKIVFNDPWRGV